MKKITTILVVLLCTNWAIAQVVVDYITPANAVAALLGEGVEASNISSVGTSVQFGYITGAEGTIFPIGEGVLLSTADAENFEDPNSFGETGGGTSGDADLLDIANSVPPLIGQNFSVSSANDIAILEFDFIPQGDTISFNYSFGSDEYLEWVNSTYNDVFAFFLSGPGIVGPYDSPAGFPDGAINIAFLPNTDPELPITISSVNNALNDEYYIDNVNNNDVQQDGFTVSLTAVGVVQCGQTYHIKLAIADGSDTALESIVVLEAGSFTSSQPSIVANVDNTGLSVPDNTLIEGCLDGFITVTKANCDDSESIELSFGGTAGMVADYEFIETTIFFPAGQNSIEIPITTVADGITEGTETIEISFTYVDLFGDTVVADAVLSIMDYVELDLQVDHVFVCPGGTADALAQVSDGIGPFQISWSNNTSGTTTEFGEGDAGDYFGTVTDFCLHTDTSNFTVFEPDPLAIGNVSDFYCIGIDTDALVSGGTMPYVFTYASDSLILLDGGGFTSEYVGDYTISIEDGCGEDLDVVLSFEACVTIIPNVFTPNNDNGNDAFQIGGIQGYPNSRLGVYNRWGQLVYENTNYQNTWNGQDDTGQPLPDGTYYYVFERTDGEKFTGNVALLREIK